MPIRKLKLSARTLSAAVLSEDKLQNLYTLIENFLLINEEPADEQVHLLAAALGLSKEELEQHLFKFFSDTLEDQDSDSFGADTSDEDFDSSRLESSDLRASEPHSLLMEDDGVEDPELLGREDPIKEASEADGAVDEEVLLEQQGKL